MYSKHALQKKAQVFSSSSSRHPYALPHATNTIFLSTHYMLNIIFFSFRVLFFHGLSTSPSPSFLSERVCVHFNFFLDVFYSALPNFSRRQLSMFFLIYFDLAPFFFACFFFFLLFFYFLLFSS